MVLEELFHHQHHYDQYYNYHYNHYYHYEHYYHLYQLLMIDIKMDDFAAIDVTPQELFQNHSI